MECRERTSGELRAHLTAIDRIVDRWQSGEITLAEKRETIARENAFYHGQERRGRTGSLITAGPAGYERIPSAAGEDRQRGWQFEEEELPVWWHDA